MRKELSKKVYSSQISARSSCVAIPICRCTILSVLLVDIIISEEVGDARLCERLGRRIIESTIASNICVHCGVAIEGIRYIPTICIVSYV